jgi:hypothetical protein
VAPSLGSSTPARERSHPGLYRVRAIGTDLLLGERGDVPRRVGKDLRAAYKPTIPLEQPRTAAPAFWVANHRIGMTFEYSTLSLAGFTTPERKGLEAVATAIYRQGSGSPAVCFGRMPQGWSRSTSVDRHEHGTTLK